VTLPRSRPAVSVEAVSKSFGAAVAVRELTLDIAKGEFFTLLGPSGCGKTTTLRMIGGFVLPDTGRILIDDRDVTREPPNRRPSNMVFQQYALFPHLTVHDNVAFGPSEAGAERREIERRVGEALELVQLSGYSARKPHELSGGQQQRVALARALINRPAVLLLDEPLGALDLKMRRAMQYELKRIQREVAITFVYVTHDQEEALTMSDRIAVMRDGVAEQVGSPRDVYDQPASLFVAGFIGETNVLPSTVVACGAASATVRLDIGGTIDVPTGAGLAAGDRAAVLVRPEALRFGSDVSAAQGRQRLGGRVMESVFQGSVIRTVVALPNGARLVVATPKDSVMPAASGDEVTLSWRPEDARALRDESVPGTASR
jgi:spermidine/putrescine transport system ATP-binding protein